MLDTGRLVAQAVKRPNLTFSAEREPAGIVGALAFMFIMLGIGLWLPWVFFAGFAVLGLLPILQKVARHDPQFFEVYRRHLRFRSFYPARSTPWCKL